MTKILAIDGSYRDHGITDQAVEAAAAAARGAGAEVEIIYLRDFPIEFCLNCRECTQLPGEAPGQCVQHDAMHELVEKIEAADAYILASPTNFYTVTALFKRFEERLVVYAYWPWDMPAPQERKAGAVKKKALLISSCAAPGLLGRLFYNTQKQLKATAKVIGAKPVGSLFIGLIGMQHPPRLPDQARMKAANLALRLTR